MQPSQLFTLPLTHVWHSLGRRFALQFQQNVRTVPVNSDSMAKIAMPSMNLKWWCEIDYFSGRTFRLANEKRWPIIHCPWPSLRWALLARTFFRTWLSSDFDMTTRTSSLWRRSNGYRGSPSWEQWDWVSPCHSSFLWIKTSRRLWSTIRATSASSRSFLDVWYFSLDNHARLVRNDEPFIFFQNANSQIKERTGLPLGFVRGGPGDGLSFRLWFALDARHAASFAATRSRFGWRRGKGRPRARLRNVIIIFG